MVTVMTLHNFNAGPSTLPLQVKESVNKAIIGLDQGPGILELSHRSPAFDQIIERAKNRISKLYQLPNTHEVLFLQGGASLQFAMIPFNLGTNGGFITTGEWSKRALAEAQRLVYEETAIPIELHSEAINGFRATPKVVSLACVEKSSLRYIHLTSNNTIFGTQYSDLPKVIDVPDGHQPPFIIDASSDLFSKVVDWSKVDILYGGAQKNAGPSGITLVIGRKELLRQAAVHPSCPKILEYRTHAEKGSLYHTPNTLGIYAIGEVAEWVLQHGGLAAMADRAQRRAQALYQIIDESEVYTGHAELDSRSLMNITFRGRNSELETRLLEKAKCLNMFGLKGHRSVGGLRASLYNAVSDDSVEVLCSLLKDIERETK